MVVGPIPDTLSSDTSINRFVYKRDEHFLRRLERLNGQQVELALVLYRDSELVKMLLNELKVSDSAARVAISLNHPVRGPFVIVTREGQFVTCLGDGMGVSGHPVITREQIERTSRAIQRARDIFAETARHPYREVGRVFEKLLNCGPRLSREDFEVFAAWQPLLAPQIYEYYMRLNLRECEGFKTLAKDGNYRKPYYAPLLMRHWADTWALMHFRFLLGVDGGTFLREAFELTDGPRLANVLCEPTRFNVLSYATCATWLAAKVGKPLVASQKKRYASGRTVHDWVNSGLVLSAIAFGHRKLQAEIGKLLSFEGASKENAEAHDGLETRRFIANEHESSLRVLDGVKARLERYAMHATVREHPALTLESRIALFLGSQVVLQSRVGSALPSLFRLLPWIARAKATDFYLAREQLDLVWFNKPEEEALLFIDPQLSRESSETSSALQTVKAVSKPGRNNSCPCGSGKKYKRCCAA
jgi:hypothetical protein